jgi:hypothetical protein
LWTRVWNLVSMQRGELLDNLWECCLFVCLFLGQGKTKYWRSEGLAPLILNLGTTWCD